MLRTLSGDLIPIARPPRKRLVDSFDAWLHLCTKYEMEIVSALPERYVELAAFREQIQLAKRKFRWPSVYLFDIRTRVHAASRKDVHPRLEVLTWRACLRTHQDADVVTDLLHDFEFEVRVGYQPALFKHTTIINLGELIPGP